MPKAKSNGKQVTWDPKSVQPITFSAFPAGRTTTKPDDLKVVVAHRNKVQKGIMESDEVTEPNKQRVVALAQEKSHNPQDRILLMAASIKGKANSPDEKASEAVEILDSGSQVKLMEKSLLDPGELERSKYESLRTATGSYSYEPKMVVACENEVEEGPAPISAGLLSMEESAMALAYLLLSYLHMKYRASRELLVGNLPPAVCPIPESEPEKIRGYSMLETEMNEPNRHVPLDVGMKFQGLRLATEEYFARCVMEAEVSRCDRKAIFRCKGYVRYIPEQFIECQKALWTVALVAVAGLMVLLIIHLNPIGEMLYGEGRVPQLVDLSYGCAKAQLTMGTTAGDVYFFTTGGFGHMDLMAKGSKYGIEYPVPLCLREPRDRWVLSFVPVELIRVIPPPPPPPPPIRIAPRGQRFDEAPLPPPPPLRNKEGRAESPGRGRREEEGRMINELKIMIISGEPKLFTLCPRFSLYLIMIGIIARMQGRVGVIVNGSLGNIKPELWAKFFIYPFLHLKYILPIFAKNMVGINISQAIPAVIGGGEQPLGKPDITSSLGLFEPDASESNESSMEEEVPCRQKISKAGKAKLALVSKKRKGKKREKRVKKAKNKEFKAAVKAAHAFFESQQAKRRANVMAPTHEVHGRTSIASYRMNRLRAEYVRRYAMNEESDSILLRLILLSPECHQNG
jgi:hypothetical protein